MALDGNFCRSLRDGLLTSFVDASVASEQNLRAQLLANDMSGSGTKVISVLEQELLRCQKFDFSVAFITMGGITPLLQTFKELEARGIKGRILTTNYLMFTDPRALEKLAGLSNIEIKFFRTEEAGQTGFHTKGYIFDRGRLRSIIVGSSNLTQTALTVNQEWNARLVSAAEGEFARQIQTEFDALWEHPASHALEDVLDDYRIEYEQTKTVRRAFFSQEPTLAGGLVHHEIRPNAMQKRLADNLLTLMRKEEPGADITVPKKGLLISATGTGKTYASAFALKAIQPKRALFLVHREQIARKSLESYRHVMGQSYTYGVFIGQQQETDRDIVFATMQTMVKHLNDGTFAPTEFDVIVIDEVHRAGAASYDRIMQHFKPKLWFGMTATPERPDGFDVYGLFGHNILTEIRLQQALANDLLCPFHYFGISGLSVNDKDYETKDFSKLASDDRVEHILKQSAYYGYSGVRLKALVFCSSNEEARLLSEKFNSRGLRTVHLSGSDSQSTREDTCRRLALDEGDVALDYVFSVDIFNEGIDIPEVNQVILLRPTQSPIVFMQQIGRGLRKHESKEYVVILDFIGEYNNNFLIPVALSGDRTYNKDYMRRVVSTGTQVLSGPSSIHFDAISRERIYKAIDSARTNTMSSLREAYRLLKFKLGRIPSILDFDVHGLIDPMKIFDACGTYYDFLKKMEKDGEDFGEMDAAAQKYLSYLTQRLGNAQRLSESVVIELILKGERDQLKAAFVADFVQRFSTRPSEAHIQSCERILTSDFWRTQKEKKDNADCAVIELDDDGEWRAADTFVTTLSANPLLTRELKDLTEFIKTRYELTYKGGYGNTLLKLYERYTYEDVCRMLDWSRNITAQNIGGYFYDKPSRTLPVFVNYNKDEGAIAYEDHFVSENHMVALSKTKRKVNSSDADHIFKRTEEDKDNRIYLFVRKNKDDAEAKSFYFLGEIDAEGEPEPVKVDGGADAFEINYRLRVPVRNDIYTYLTS